LSGLEEIRGVVSVDAPITPFVHVEGHRRERVEEQELGSGVRRPALCSCLVEQLLQLDKVTEDAVGIAIRVTVYLCDAVGFRLFVCGLAPLDESELTSCVDIDHRRRVCAGTHRRRRNNLS